MEGKRSAGKLTVILGHNKSEEVLRSIAEDVDLSEDEWIRKFIKFIQGKI